MCSGFRSSCYWTDWNWANSENIRIGLVFAVLAQWKFLYYIDGFDHIQANKSKLINNVVYSEALFSQYCLLDTFPQMSSPYISQLKARHWVDTSAGELYDIFIRQVVSASVLTCFIIFTFYWILPFPKYCIYLRIVFI
jgi:hypothetical protein